MDTAPCSRDLHAKNSVTSVYREGTKEHCSRQMLESPGLVVGFSNQSRSPSSQQALNKTKTIGSGSRFIPRHSIPARGPAPLALAVGTRPLGPADSETTSSARRCPARGARCFCGLAPHCSSPPFGRVAACRERAATRRDVPCSQACCSRTRGGQRLSSRAPQEAAPEAGATLGRTGHPLRVARQGLGGERCPRCARREEWTPIGC